MELLELALGGPGVAVEADRQRCGLLSVAAGGGDGNLEDPVQERD